MMTTAHKAKLRVAREAAAERRRRREDAELSEFREWLRLEASAFRAYRSAREMFGANDAETRGAYDEWRAAMSLVPQLPPDAAFARERGEDAT